MYRKFIFIISLQKNYSSRDTIPITAHFLGRAVTWAPRRSSRTSAPPSPRGSRRRRPSSPGAESTASDHVTIIHLKARAEHWHSMRWTSFRWNHVRNNVRLIASGERRAYVQARAVQCARQTRSTCQTRSYKHLLSLLPVQLRRRTPVSADTKPWNIAGHIVTIVSGLPLSLCPYCGSRTFRDSLRSLCGQFLVIIRAWCSTKIVAIRYIVPNF